MGLPKNCGIDLFARWKSGPRNLITDVPGVKVGHVTLRRGDVNTGVTAVLPHGGNLFLDKVMGGAAVLNGFGKRYRHWGAGKHRKKSKRIFVK